MTESLFAESPAPPAVEGPFAGVALETAIDRVLDYRIPESMRDQVQIGQLVRVPLGKKNRAKQGYVVRITPTSQHPSPKDIFHISDHRILAPPKLMSLARWMSRYYVTPLGTVLESVIPSAVKKRKGIDYSTIVLLNQPRDQIQQLLETTKAPKRRAILARLLLLKENEGIDLFRLAGEAGVTPPTVRKLLKLGLISIRQEADFQGFTSALPSTVPSEGDIELNEDQRRAFDELVPKLSGEFSVSLLLGVTGSGKTEVYLQCIRRIIAQGKQAIVLVPEIALTPQTVRRFITRFPRVAILHSGLSATQRHRYWQQIASGGADVVVGARSAIFAPLPNLGMIVVDEEHEASYKQDTAPRYHGRDVAIQRAHLENIPILLGSATPSLESYWRVTRPDAGDKYSLLTLPRRVRGLAMPAVELIDMKQEVRMRRGVHLMSQRLESALKSALAGGHQAIILLNRRGYSNFVYCASCNEVTRCKYCDATMTYHRAAGANIRTAQIAPSVHAGHLQCHYCLAV
ncbi:MAG TPA: primosomal protein N', partial [Tepidisphaeraceae bacterium]|nr:primosomal protein N' [Tepidisphaeraceae bacterium]